MKSRTKHLWQRITRGWDDSETWSLDYTTSKWILPRIKRLKEINFGHPSSLGSTEEWNEVLDKMILAFNINLEQWDDDENFPANLRDPILRRKTMQEGLDLFAKYYNDLWW